MSSAPKRTLAESGIVPEVGAPAKRVKLDYLTMLWSLPMPSGAAPLASSGGHVFSVAPPAGCNIRRLLVGAKPAYVWACYACGLLPTMRSSQVKILRLLRDEALGHGEEPIQRLPAVGDDEEVGESDASDSVSESVFSSVDVPSSDDDDEEGDSGGAPGVEEIVAPDIDVEAVDDEEEEDDDEDDDELEEEDSDEGLEMEVDDMEVMAQDLPPIASLLNLQLLFPAEAPPTALAALDKAMRGVVDDGSAAQTMVTILALAGLAFSGTHDIPPSVPDLKLSVVHVERGQLHFVPTTNVNDITAAMIDRE